jgi:hypothetical protein
VENEWYGRYVENHGILAPPHIATLLSALFQKYIQKSQHFTIKAHKNRKTTYV